MSTVRLLLILALFPALTALGHDMYLFYEQHGVNSIIADAQQAAEEKGWTSMFASLGYIWTRYSEESYRATAEIMPPEDWARINTLLAQKAFFVGLAFAGFWYVLAFILKLLGFGSGDRKVSVTTGRQSRINELMGRKKTTSSKYKRK